MATTHATIDFTARLDALAEGTRLRIARILEMEELSVGELAKVIKVPQSTVSRHLKILSEARWLNRRQVGTATFYSLVTDDLDEEDRRIWLAVREAADRQDDMASDLRRLRSVLTERRLDSLAFFGQVGSEWDVVRNELFGVGFTPRALLAMLNPTWRVADVGCGSGNATEHLAPYVERVIAIDQSQTMLDAARARLEDVDNVDFRIGDFDNLPIEDAELDALVSVLVLHHVEDLEGAIASSARVLKVGGRIVLVDMMAHNRDAFRRSMGHVHLGFPSNMLGGILESHGFTHVREQPLATASDSRGPGLFVVSGTRGPTIGSA